jgi:hypothetical protein
MLSGFVCFALGSTSSTSSTNINNSSATTSLAANVNNSRATTSSAANVNSSSATTSSMTTTSCKFFIRTLFKNCENLLKKRVLMMNRFLIEDHQSCVCQVIGFYLKVNGYINFEE